MAIVGSGWIKSVRQCCPTPFDPSTESVSLGSRMTTKGHLACGHEAVTSGSYRCIPIYRQQHAIRPIFTPVAPEEQPQHLNAAGQGNLPTSGLGRTAFLDTESGYSCARWSL